MSVEAFRELVCPLEGEALQSDGKTWRCSSGHCFDIARQGYTNLLPVQHMRSRNPGDTREMIEARLRFLNTGFYAPIAEAVAQTVLVGSTQPTSILDAGCGEGYYLRRLQETASKTHKLQLIGLDISKPAILASARQDKNPTWVVASNAKIPVKANSLDRIICLFGFPVYSEFARILKQDGELVLVEAGANHLLELRKLIYPSIKEEKTVSSNPPAGFVGLGKQNLQFNFTLDNREQISDLLLMTPHLFRTTAEGRAKAMMQKSLKLTADIWLTRYGLESPTREIDKQSPKKKPPLQFDWQSKSPVAQIEPGRDKTAAPPE